MQPEDTAALEQARWAEFVAQLADHLAAQWPAMPERLGERYAAFVEHAVQHALKRGFTQALAVARYVNLCFVWGPLFHDKPGFEWALGLLAAPRLRPGDEWAVSHRLLRRSQAELARLPESRIDAAALAAADERLLEVFGALGRHGELHPDEPAPAPRAACDLEAVELRLLEPAQTKRYVLDAGAWQRAAMPQPPALRVDAARPLPALIGVLSQPPGGDATGPPARLQLRARMHAVCDGDRHPTLDFLGSHGRWRWRGHETRAASWPVAALAQAAAAGGPGSAVAEETAPDIHRLDLSCCGVRDEGDAIGSLSTQVWAWPAAQWWLELLRARPAVQAVSTRTEAARGATRCRVECDGAAADTAPLIRGFEQGLDRAGSAALQALLAAWSSLEGLEQPVLQASLGLLTGNAALAWGWHLGASGMDGRAFMRVLGGIEMEACAADLQFEGELALGGARSRITLACKQSAPLAATLRREANPPPLLDALTPARVSFRLPFVAEIVPLGSDSGALLDRAGACSGALVGEAGLRPRTSGGSGHEWFASLRLEAVTLPVELRDPVLGHQRQTLHLLAERGLLDWRLA